MKKDYLILFLAIFVLLGVFIILAINFYPSQTKKEALNIENPQIQKIPEPGDVVDEKIAVPSTKVETGKTNFRKFYLNLNNESLDKTYIIAQKDEILNIEFNASDKDYDLSVPQYFLMISVPKGKSKIIEFQATREGNFKIICDNCKNKEIGYLMIKK
ncbi:MAG: hypothetical protein C4348_02830 [Patescibacteria group bacterium]